MELVEGILYYVPPLWRKVAIEAILALVQYERNKTPNREVPVDVTMGPNQKVPLALKARGVQGGDTVLQFENRVSWSADSGVLALVPSANGLAVEALAQGVEGISTVSVSATDAAGNMFTAIITIEVKVVVPPPPELTESISIEAGTPVDQ